MTAARLKIRLLPVVIAGLMLCLAGLFWPTASRRQQFTVAVNIWPGAEGLLSARSAPGFQNVPATFLEFSWSAAVVGAFQKRVADAAVVSLDELLRLETAGDAQPQAVLVLGIPGGCDAIFARPGITSVPLLRGKKVGVELHSAGEYLLKATLHKHGMTLADVEIVALNLAETEAAYVEKDLDAVVTADPWRVRLADRGAVLLADASDMGLELCRVLVVRRDAVQRFRAETASLVRVCLEHANKQGPCWQANGLAAVLRREDLTPGQWGRALKAVHLPGAQENIRLLEEQLPLALQTVAERLGTDAEMNENKPLEPKQLLNAEFVKEVLP